MVGSAPAANRTRTSGFGGLRDIRFTTGADLQVPNMGEVDAAMGHPHQPHAAVAIGARAGAVQILAPAKLNLNFRIVGRRMDGYHRIESWVVPITIWDTIHVQVLPARVDDIRISCNGGSVPEGPENLVFQAVRRILRGERRTFSMRIAIDKIIPSGAGLGGGSSDAAAILSLLNRWRTKPLARADLIQLGMELGADLPFFLNGRPAYVSGVGETLSAARAIGANWFVVAFPGIRLATASVFREFDRSADSLTSGGSQSIFSDQIEADDPMWFGNDLEVSAARICPEISLLKTQLADMGAYRPRMTGSGSAVFGEFKNAESARRAARDLQRRGVWARAARRLDTLPTAMS